MSAIAIIPARGGSRRIKKKNIRDFFGKPIIAYSIETALESTLFDRVVVSSDDDEIIKVALDYGANGYKRDPEYGRDEVGTQEVTRECLKGLQWNGDFACCIYATAPMMTKYDLRLGHERLDLYDVEYAVSVGYPPLRDAGQFYWALTHCFNAAEPLWSEPTIGVEIDSKRVCDINTEDDWHRAEEMYKALHGGGVS